MNWPSRRSGSSTTPPTSQVLQGKLKAVNAGLKDDLARLKNIARYAEIAGKVADALTKLAEMAAKAAI